MLLPAVNRLQTTFTAARAFSMALPSELIRGPMAWRVQAIRAQSMSRKA
jgi:hypothetical protein